MAGQINEDQHQDFEVLTGPHHDVAGYFKGLSAAYSRQTGDTTFSLAQQFLSQLSETSFSPSGAVVHDNACGVGTASLALLSTIHRLGGDEERGSIRRIEATDSSTPMIDQLQKHITAVKESLTSINPAVQDSHSLSFPDNTFTLSITNFSVTNFADAPKALREIHRTIRPGKDGLAVVSIWKRFTVAEVVHRAQRVIRGDAVELVPIPQAEYFQDGYLRDRMVEAGFKDVQQHVEVTTITGEPLMGLQDFITGDLLLVHCADWSEDEKSRWPNAVDKVLKEEIARAGGLVIEAWFVTGRK